MHLAALLRYTLYTWCIIHHVTSQTKSYLDESETETSGMPDEDDEEFENEHFRYCVKGAPGETDETTDQPWTKYFDASPSEETDIDCLHYVRPYSTISDGTLTLPTSPQQGYKYELQIPDRVTSINFTIYVNVHAKIDVDQNDLGVFNNLTIHLMTGPWNVHTQDEIEVRYPEDYNEEKYVIIIIQNQYGVPMDTLNVTLNFISDESSEIPTSSAPFDVTQDIGYMSEAPDYENTVEILEEDTTTEKALTVTAEGLPPDPCTSVTCEFGAICTLGDCLCPKASSCSTGSDDKEICASGRTFPTQCHLEIESCHTQTAIEFVAGSCEETSPTETAHSVGVHDSAIFWRHRDLFIVIITLTIVIIIIVIIVCIQRRRKSRSLSITKQEESRVYLQPRNKPARSTSSSSDNYRSSPKPKHYMSIEEEKPASTVIDPDRFSLTGCITPLVEETPANPFASFKPEEMENRNSSDEPKQDGDSGIEELDRPSDVTESQKPQVRNEPDVKFRQNPPRRNTSTTENSVYEIRPETNAAFDLEVIDNAFEDNSRVTTTV